MENVEYHRCFRGGILFFSSSSFYSVHTDKWSPGSGRKTTGMLEADFERTIV